MGGSFSVSMPGAQCPWRGHAVLRQPGTMLKQSPPRLLQLMLSPQRLSQALESFLQISRQIFWCFQADVIAEHKAGVRPGNGGA